jgi:hypothetical protein
LKTTKNNPAGALRLVQRGANAKDSIGKLSGEVNTFFRPFLKFFDRSFGLKKWLSA